MAGKLDLAQLRNLVRQYIDSHLYKTAQFWADKVCTLSKNNAPDVLWLAHTFYLTNQYLRAAHLLKSKGLIRINSTARYLAAKCYYECKDWRSAIEVLEGDYQELKVDKTFSQNTNLSLNNCSIDSISDFTSSSVGGNRKIESATSLLKGMIYEALENRDIAVQCYKDALQHDVYCYEAFDKIVSHNALSVGDETNLLETLPFSQQCSPAEEKLARFVYECKINKYAKPVEPKLPSDIELLLDNLDYVVCIAERHFNNCDYRNAFKYTTMVMKADPLHEACLPLHISLLC